MENLKKNFTVKLTASFLIVILLLTVTTALALAQSGARVYLNTVEAVDNTLVVDVMAENVTDLYGAEFRVKYDPAVVAVQDVKPDQAGIQIETGELLPSNQGFVVANETNEAEGIVTFAMTLLNPAPPVSGAGPLARISFSKLQNVPSTINVEHAKLVAVDLQTIPSQTDMLALGGDSNQAEVVAGNSSDDTAAAPVEIEPQAAAAPAEAAQSVERGDFPWWIVAAVIMVLGVLVLGGFIVMNGLKTATVLSGASQATQAPNKQQQPSRGRPSAFKNRS
jgi:flagellar basal body-associated protein FliL